MTMPNRAVVHRILHLAVEIRWLQNAGREVDAIQLCIVVGVDGWRSHIPFCAVDRFADLAELAVELKSGGFVNVFQIAGAANLYCGVIAPLIRVSDFILDSVQLDLRLRLW